MPVAMAGAQYWHAPGSSPGSHEGVGYSVPQQGVPGLASRPCGSIWSLLLVCGSFAYAMHVWLVSPADRLLTAAHALAAGLIF